MRDKILKFLKEHNTFVSGEELSALFNISRTAVWKHINTLRSIGYVIESKSNKGYKFISQPDLLVQEELRALLDTKIIGRNIILKQTIDSTNIEAKKMGSSLDFIDGTLIASEEQTLGTGRFGRSWCSPKGGLWFSLLLKPNIEPQNAFRLTQIAAASLILTLSKYNIKGKIKWPNDIYINDKKVAGILTEMKCDMDLINYVVVGIGCNINIPSFNEDTRNIATSIYLEKKNLINRNEFLGKFLNKFEELYLSFVENDDLIEVININKTFSYMPNKDGYLITVKGKEKITCLKVGDMGELLVKGEDGKEKAILSGEISFKK